MEKYFVHPAPTAELSAEQRSLLVSQPHADVEMALAPMDPSLPVVNGGVQQSVQLQADALEASGHGDAGTNAGRVPTEMAPSAQRQEGEVPVPPTQGPTLKQGLIGKQKLGMQQSVVIKEEQEQTAKQEPVVARTCAFCPSKKHIAAGCVNSACKKCCLARAEVCNAHPKVDPRIKLEEQRQHEWQKRAKKPVLKNEFREANFVYYAETVTLFSVREFFEKKKLSQPVLNDQDRSLRVDGKYLGQQLPRRKRVRDPKLKAAVCSALEKKRTRLEEPKTTSKPVKPMVDSATSNGAQEGVPGSGC